MAGNKRKANRQNQEVAHAVNRAARAFGKSSKQQKIVIVAIALVLVAVLAGLMLYSPAFKDAVYTALGITRPAAVAEEIQSATKVHIIDVGQGDATLLEQNGTFALIDAGPPDSRDDLLAYLDAVGVQTLRYVFLTHPHDDHYGGMQAVVERYAIETMVLPNLQLAPAPTAKAFQNLLAALADGNVHTETLAENGVYALGSGNITVLQAGLATQDNYNVLSPTLLFEADGLRFINSGDAEKANERALLENGENPRADIFAAAHHGSYTSNSEALVQAVSPSVVVVSCGRNNRYGHPHREPMEAFEAVGAKVLRTDEDGTVVLGLGEDGEIVYATTGKQAADAALCAWPGRAHLRFTA